jgi:putative phage-type endonuclease
MRNTYGSQQSDAWLRNRVGRIPGSRIADVCSYLVIKSRAGESSAKRNNYKMELIAERLTGRAKDHYVSPAMEHGTATENDARLYYEGALRVMCEPVSFVLHPKYDFTGCSPDSLVAAEGVLEIKCPETTTHLEYVEGGRIPDEYLPQIAWELVCTERKWADFVSYDPRIQDDLLRFFYRRIGRDEFEWKVGERLLTGEAVLDYFTSEVIKLNAEIEYFFASHDAKPVAPYPVELITEDGEIQDAAELTESEAYDSAAAVIDQMEMTP